MNIISRIKNRGLWTSIIASIPIILQSYGINIIPEQFNELINIILSIFIFFGFLNNPTTKNNGYLDD